MIIKIKYDNKTVQLAMAKQYAKLYAWRFCDWFDSKSGARSITTVN